jgi:hypothetical protein
VLDDVQRWAFLVEPAREDPRPVLVRPLHVQLNEGAGELLRFPRRRGFTGAQADDDILHADRLARTQRQVADDAVALVQEAKNRDPFRHRRDARLVGRRARHLDGDRIALGRLVVAARATC